MKKYNGLKRILAMALVLAMFLGLAPAMALTTNAAVNPAAVVEADPGTAHTWENILGTHADGSRYAGRVWVDKSVYKNGDTVLLDTAGVEGQSSFTVKLDEAKGESFQVVFSALGSSMSTNTVISSQKPLDVVLVLDTSTSMTTYSSGKSRLQHMIEAANQLLEDLLQLEDIRIAIVSFNRDSETVIELAKYTNGIVLSTNHYTNTNGGGIIYARDKSGVLLGNDSGYQTGTNLQDGIDRGMNILAGAQNVSGRAPVAIVLADGRANRAVNDDWYTVSESNRQSSGDAGIMLSTLLNAAYGRARVQNHYGTDMTVYGIGIDLSSTSNDYIFLNPGATVGGFNASNSDDAVSDAWAAFQTWKAGNTAQIKTGSGRNQTTWTFDHDLPAGSGVTSLEVAANINYVDNYQNVGSATLGEAFDKIYEDLAVSAFNPITNTVNAATGVEETPLIYADNIGQYMQIKSIQAVSLFGSTYPVNRNEDGTYTVTAATGVNPTTGEAWNTAEDIQIKVLERADGTQQLRIYISQEILPILLDKINVRTENGATTATIEQLSQRPLRVYYTVGLSEEILLANGQVDINKLDSSYAHTDPSTGAVTFYSNAFGQMNTADKNGNGLVELGDAHVGFVPSHANRYYYHQTQQEIFVSATNADGSDITWEAGEYGVRWQSGKFDLEVLTYADYKELPDSHQVYTYVNFYRPTAAEGDGNAAEQVTYLIYAAWGDMQDSVGFYDKVNKVHLNGGVAIEPDQVAAVVGEYIASHGLAETDLIAVLGDQSQRVSRLHNMYSYKQANNTESAELAYAPSYNKGAHDADDIHEHSEVIVWLGNNGALTVAPATGIQVTKTVTEQAPEAEEGEKFEITVTLSQAAPDAAVTDVNGNALPEGTWTTQDYRVFTLYLAHNETVYITGLAAGTTYTVTEAPHQYYAPTYLYENTTGVVAAGKIQGVTVQNHLKKPGNLYITKEVLHAHQGESFPTDYEFEFQVTFLDDQGAPVANQAFQLENNYDASLTELTTNENGVMTGKLRHGETVLIKDIPAGTVVTVQEVNVPENYIPAYRSINASGQEADTDGTVVIQSEQNATVVALNTYAPKSVSVSLDLQVQKNLHADIQPGEALDFRFALEKWNGTGWESVHTYALSFQPEEVTPGQDNIKHQKLEEAVISRQFTQAGTYTYRIYEIYPDAPAAGVAYDRTVYTVTVTVEDVNGQLVAAVKDQSNQALTDTDSDGDLDYTAAFLNEAHAATVSIDIAKEVRDTTRNPLISQAGFAFVARTAQVNEAGEWIVKEDGRTYTVYSDAAGKARMTDVYKTPGSYRYIISEVAGSAAGWTYDSTQYWVWVEVTQDEQTGDLTASMVVTAVDAAGNRTELQTAGDSATLPFVNTYDPADGQVDLDVIPTVVKELKGREVTQGEFLFAIFEDGTASFTDTAKAIMLGTNDANGHVAFQATPYGVQLGLADGESHTLRFAAVGTYYFDVVEIKNGLGGVTYDETIYDLVVEVTDPGDGSLAADYFFEDSTTKQVAFHNSYKASPTQVVIQGQKSIQVISGVKALTEGMFTFGLYEGDVLIGRTTNLANGRFAFDAIEYAMDQVGTYTYTVREIAPDGTTDGSYSAGGLSYSGRSFTVTVVVSDAGNGQLSAEVTGNGAEAIHFVNTYRSQPVTVALQGTKTLSGRTLAAGEFRFALYQSNRTFEENVLVNDTITHDAAGKFTVNFGTLDMGDHYFVVKEAVPQTPAAGIHYSGAEYRISIHVTDSGNGSMRYSLSVVNPGEPENTDPDIVFNNLYRPENGELILGGNKVLEGGKPLAAGQFSFLLCGLDAEGEVAVLSQAEAAADGTFYFDPIVYTADQIGTHTYTVKESIPQEATAENGWTAGSIVYDPAEYTVVVTVSDEDKDGSLEITKTVNGSENTSVTFTNIHVPGPVEYVLQAHKTYEKGLKGDDFTFQLEGRIGSEKIQQTKKNDADGVITFDALVFPQAGTYTFTVKETDKILGFISYSVAEYQVTVTVVNRQGVLVVEDVSSVNVKNTGESDLRFVNTYVLDGQGEVVLNGTKQLTGHRTTVNAGEFTFGLYDSQGKLVESVTNDAAGNFTFAALLFDETHVSVSGQTVYTYTVQELPGSNPGMTYDAAVYTVTVTVADDHQGGVAVSHEITRGDEPAQLQFNNHYQITGTGQVQIAGTKTYEGRTLKGNDFTFVLAEGSAELERVQNAADGTFAFAPVTYTAEDIGIHSYTVSELHPEDVQKTEEGLFVKDGIVYDANVYAVEVTVADDGQGGLTVTKKVNNAPVENVNVAFDNAYQIFGSGKLELTGTKVLTGGKLLTDGAFTFGLYEGDKLVAQATNVGGIFTVTKLYTAQELGQYTYTLAEVLPANAVQNADGTWSADNVTYDPAVYTVKVDVTDDQVGGIHVAYELVDAQAIAFTNTYTPAPVVLSIEVEKQLDNRTDKKVSLAGFQFQIALGQQTYEAVSDEQGLTGFTVTFGAGDVGKTYTFQITEKNTGIKGMTYDKTVHTVTVEVQQNEDGTLKTIIDGAETDKLRVGFTNIYEKLVTPPTGDSFNMVLPIVLMVLSILGIGVILIARKKKAA